MASLLMLLPPIPILQYIILLMLIQMPPYLSSYDYFTDCANNYGCGGIKNISFPFWGGDRPYECGHPMLHLICKENNSYITIKDVMFQVLEAIPDAHTLRIARVDYLPDQCPLNFVNTTLDPELFVYGSNYTNLTLFYGCTSPIAFPFTTGRLPCIPNGFSELVYTQFGAVGPPVFCNTSVVVPVPPSLDATEDFTKVLGAIRDGFIVRWIAGVEKCEKCMKSGRVCGYDLMNQTTCYCRDQSCSFIPNAKGPTGPPQAQQPPPPGMSNVH